MDKGHIFLCCGGRSRTGRKGEGLRHRREVGKAVAVLRSREDTFVRGGQRSAVTQMTPHTSLRTAPLAHPELLQLSDLLER